MLRASRENLTERQQTRLRTAIGAHLADDEVRLAWQCAPYGTVLEPGSLSPVRSDRCTCGLWDSFLRFRGSQRDVEPRPAPRAINRAAIRRHRTSRLLFKVLNKRFFNPKNTVLV